MQEKPGLYLDQDLLLHNVGWKVQRIGWIATLIFLLMAVAGLFGTGPISRQFSRDNAASVHWEKYLRFQSDEEMLFEVNNARDSVHLSIPQEYMEYFELTNFSPAPVRTYVEKDLTNFIFLSKGKTRIYCKVTPKRSGWSETSVRIDQSSFQLSQIIYP